MKRREYYLGLNPSYLHAHLFLLLSKHQERERERLGKEKKIRGWCTGVSMIPRQKRIPFIRLAGEPRICAPFTFIT